MSSTVGYILANRSILCKKHNDVSQFRKRLSDRILFVSIPYVFVHDVPEFVKRRGFGKSAQRPKVIVRRYSHVPAPLDVFGHQILPQRSVRSEQQVGNLRKKI